MERLRFFTRTRWRRPGGDTLGKAACLRDVWKLEERCLTGIIIRNITCSIHIYYIYIMYIWYMMIYVYIYTHKLWDLMIFDFDHTGWWTAWICNFYFYFVRWSEVIWADCFWTCWNHQLVVMGDGFMCLHLSKIMASLCWCLLFKAVILLPNFRGKRKPSMDRLRPGTHEWSKGVRFFALRLWVFRLSMQ